jgi:hypothetical protein
MFCAKLEQFANIFLSSTKYIEYAANRLVHLCLDRNLADFAEYRQISCYNN